VKLATERRYDIRAGFSSENGIYPDLLPQPKALINRLKAASFATSLYCERSYRHAGKLVLMFLNDYQINPCWTHPRKSLGKLAKSLAVMTPDYSVFSERPRGEHIMNIYRSRWCGRFYQENGLHVVPHLVFTDRASWEYCFLGIPQHQVLVVDAPSWNADDLTGYWAGLEHAIDLLSPSLLLVHGSLRGHTLGCETLELTRFVDRWAHGS